MANRDENRHLSRSEFMRIVSIKDGPPEDADEQAKMWWYWDHFSNGEEMTMKDFKDGMSVEYHETPNWEETAEYVFRTLDTNADAILSHDEYMAALDMEWPEEESTTTADP